MLYNIIFKKHNTLNLKSGLIFVTMVNKAQSSRKLKSTPRLTTRSRNKKSQGVHGTRLRPATGKDEKALLETIQKIVKNELACHQLAIKHKGYK